MNASLCVIGIGVALGLAAESLGANPSIIDTATNGANSHVYYLLGNSTWTEAESAAVGAGGHLATVRSQTENDWIWSRWGNGRNLWIGLNDAATEGSFVWSSGEQSDYRKWRPGEPNNGGSVGGNEDYVYIMGAGLNGADAWNDMADIKETPQQPQFFGVVETIPEPGTASLILIAGGLSIVTIRRLRNHQKIPSPRRRGRLANSRCP